jgi:hypothetical protein
MRAVRCGHAREAYTATSRRFSVGVFGMRREAAPVSQYHAFLESKALTPPSCGVTVVPELAGHLFRFQREAVDFGREMASMRT